jgi:hypothetical protein
MERIGMSWLYELEYGLRNEGAMGMIFEGGREAISAGYEFVESKRIWRMGNISVIQLGREMPSEL